MQEKINLLLTISYMGTNYSGWQVQPNKSTIQGEIEKVFEKVFNEKISVVGSGRTDAGVHALFARANVLVSKSFILKHFTNGGKFNFNKLIFTLNNLLPSDIRILKIKRVSLSFNARFSAKQKTYRYVLQSGGILTPFDALTTAFIPQKLDLIAMKTASECLLGEHDFTAFCSAQTSTNDHIRTIYNISIKPSGNKVYIEITGNGFLYNMVRIIVGTLIDVGTGKIPASEVKTILESKNRSLAGKTFPAHALFLKKVKY